MKYQLAFLFTQPPFGTATSREGLDALLAASAFCDEDDILILFLDDGVFNLLEAAEPVEILQKNHLATFKLLELYELSECYICQESVSERGLESSQFSLKHAKLQPRAELIGKLKSATKVLNF